MPCFLLGIAPNERPFMLILHKNLGGGELSNYFNDKEGFREVKRIFLNADAVYVLENKLLDDYPEFKLSLKNAMSINKIRVTGDAHFIYPLHIQVEITEACNLHCDYCYRNANSDIRHSKYISWPKLKGLLSELKKTGMTELGITGGEATLHPDFPNILRYALENFEQVELITNGTNAEILENAISKVPMDERKKLNLSISFNRWMREYKMFLKGKHYLNRTIPAISRYRPIRILATDYLFDSKAWNLLSAELKKQGAVTVECNIARPIGRGKEVTDTSKYLEERKEAPAPEEGSNGYEEWYSYSNCGLVLRHTAIGPDGNARPCALFPLDDQVGFGNIFERNLNLFKDPEIIRYYHMPAPSKEICGGCANLRYCEGCIFQGIYAKKTSCNYKIKIDMKDGAR